MEASMKTKACVSLLIRSSMCLPLGLGFILTFFAMTYGEKKRVGKNDDPAPTGFVGCLFLLRLPNGFVAVARLPEVGCFIVPF